MAKSKVNRCYYGMERKPERRRVVLVFRSPIERAVWIAEKPLVRVEIGES